MENSNQEHVFIEDIIYCPSQIYYYFTEPNEEKLWVAYIRQRSGPLSFELVEIERETGNWLWDYERGNSIKLSRTYDINNQPNEEEEEKVIVEVEEEVMWFLRQQFPHLEFPKTPKRIKRGFS